MITITKIITFSASHRYWRPEWSEEKNHQVFGRCANAFGHGHNYRLEVTLRGEVDPITGMIIDLKKVKANLEEQLMDHLDHQYLNEAIPYFQQVVPTTENLVLYLRGRLDGLFPGAVLHRLRLWESDDLYAEWTEDPPCSP